MSKHLYIKVGKDFYLADKFYFLRIKKLRNQISAMKYTIKNYNERIAVKEKFIADTLKEVKDKCRKRI